jgi:phenylalanyl-tRNA synthetase beta chain
MLISWNWLNRYIDLSELDPKEVGTQFTLKVAELDDIYEVGSGLEGVRTARIKSVSSHENAKKLSVVEIECDEESHTVVCGAPNVVGAEGMVVAWVTPGTTLPDGHLIQAAELRGVLSQGMLASEAELKLSDNHDGILLLPGDTAVGCSLTDAVPIHDWVWEVDNKAITHRADLWGHYGIAREVSMLTNQPLRPIPEAFSFGESDPVTFNQPLPKGCLRYLTTRVDNVVVRPSPQWLQRLLIAAGVRPVSNVVDLTNFVMMETGNPLHAFDARDVRGSELMVSLACDDVEVETLDGQARKVPKGALLISDGVGPVAVAGVMGCGNSQIRNDTQSVVLEAACFEAESVRKTSLAIGLRTDSSARFEKALAPEMSAIAASLFCTHLKDLCPDAEFSYRLIDTLTEAREAKQIKLPLAYARQRLGVDLSREDVLRIFDALGLATESDDDSVSITVPYWRAGRDLNHAEDLIEELGRSIGYYAIEPKSPEVSLGKPYQRPGKVQERTARRIFSMTAGYHEILSYAFAHDPTKSKLLTEPDLGMEMANPISTDWSRMRRSLMPNLLKAAVENRRYGQQFGLFEIGRVFEPVDSGVGPQPRRLGWLSVHNHTPEPQELHLVQQRGHIAELLRALNLGAVQLRSGVEGFEFEKQWMHPTKSLTFYCQGIAVGYLGTLHPKVARGFSELGRETWFGEVDLDRLPDSGGAVKLFKSLPKFPGIPFDLSLEVGLDTRASDLVRLVTEYFSDCAIFEHVELFSVFMIDNEKKSLSLRFSFRSPDRSLVDTEVNPLIDALIVDLAEKHGIALRND